MRMSIRGAMKVLLGVVACSSVVWLSTGVFQTRAVDLNDLAVSFDTSRDETGQYVYLSDLALDTTHKSTTAWGSILFDKTSTDAKISLRYEGSVVTMDKGIWAHASSNVYYNLEELGIAGEYDYFTAYVGLNTTAASSSNGVIFWVYGSEDGTNWEVIYNEDRNVAKAGANADFVKVNIKKYKYLRLQAYDNGSNGNDHAVWGDAKLVKEGYNPYVVPAVADFDEYFQKAGEVEISGNAVYELNLLRRTLIRNAGQYMLSTFVKASDANREVLEWLYNDIDVLRYYLTGGKPMGNNYQNSLNVLSRLYQAHKADLADDTVSENGVRAGDVYTRMMISESLVYSAAVSSWIGGGQYSDALKRYEVFKLLYDDNRLDRKVFESLEIEEMRWVIDTMTTDDEVEWLNFYSKNKGSSDPYKYIRYTFGYNYGREQYYSEENREKWNEKYSLAEHNVEYGVTGKPKLWIVFEEGSVCGGLSKTGTNIWNTWGYPASVVGQPGHAAYVYYRQDANGNGIWGLGNNVSGWTRSEKSERLPLGWGSNSWDSYYQVSYVPYAQAALNDMDNYIKAYEAMLLADMYGDDYDKLERIYRKALGYQKFNMDAWYGLVQVYNADGRKTEADFVKLAKELAEDVKYYPLPMWDLTNLIKKRITSAAGQAEFARVQREALEAGAVATEEQVLQSSITRTMAQYLLNSNDLSMATFSFDGEKAGKIVLAQKYQDESLETVWEYSIDGKKTWSEPITAKEWQLSAEEITAINAENDVVVHIIGTDVNTDSYAIDIVEQATPSTLYANDLENRAIGATATMEWRMSAGEPWTSYAVSEPDLTGDKVVQVRNGATGTKLASDGYVELAFTADEENNKQKYIKVERLAIEGASSQATSNAGNAAFAIDGNYNTRWHSAWNGTDKDKWVTIKFDTPVFLSKIEYVPAGGGNGKILDGQILGSCDGVEFFEIGQIAGWANNETTKSVEISELEKPIQYVKIVGTRTSSASSSLSFIAARMFNFYEDATREVVDEGGDDGDSDEVVGGDVVGGDDVTEGGVTGGSDISIDAPTDIPTVLPGQDWKEEIVVGGNVNVGNVSGSGNDTVSESEVADEVATEDGVKVEQKKLAMTSSLKLQFGLDSEYFELSFEGKPEKVLVSVRTDKKVAGVYYVGSDGEAVKVEYEKDGEGRVAILSPNTGKYLIDYEEKTEEAGATDNAEEEKDNKGRYENVGVWIGVGIVVLLIVGVGVSMVNNRRR